MALAKKILLFIPAVMMMSSSLLSCSHKEKNVDYLRVLNSEDYIDKSILSDFEQIESKKNGRKVKVIYDTFDTMENMYNTLKTGKTSYDLVCASDYMVQKLVNLNLVEKIDRENSRLDVYDTNASPFIRERLKEIAWGDNYNLDDYCACYMWGTLGILYNPKFSLLKDRGLEFDEIKRAMESYDSLWNPDYRKVISIKDSMRDTYAIGLIHSFKDELSKATTESDRQKIFDYGGEDDPLAKEHIKEIKNDLLKLRENIFGFEVDSGKEDIVTEKIGIDTAWSGDAVHAIDTAEEDKGLMLYYSIPKEGSNLWFDCWTIQKEANKDLAYDFLNYLSTSEVAIKNMEEIGYTSSIATDEIASYYREIYQPINANDSGTYDISYFFDKKTILEVDTNYIGRQLSAQFPTKDEADSLMVMKDYGKNNDLILRMWEQVKHEALPAWAIALFVVEITLIAAAITIIIVIRVKNKNRRKERKIRRA